MALAVYTNRIKSHHKKKTVKLTRQKSNAQNIPTTPLHTIQQPTILFYFSLHAKIFSLSFGLNWFNDEKSFFLYNSRRESCLCCFIILFSLLLSSIKNKIFTHSQCQNRTERNKQHALNSNKYSLIQDVKSQNRDDVDRSHENHSQYWLNCSNDGWGCSNQLHHGNKFSLEVLFSCHQYGYTNTHVRDWNERRDTNMENFIKWCARVHCL